MIHARDQRFVARDAPTFYGRDEFYDDCEDDYLGEDVWAAADAATCSHAPHQAAARLGPAAFDQAQGEGR